MAEMMLRRTRAEQVVPVFRRFLRLFPTPRSLADAPPGSVKRVLRPLGLHWRAGDVVRAGRLLGREAGGRVPANAEALRALPGVGEYVARAVACFAFGRPVAVVDTNTARVVSRFFAIGCRGEPRRSREVAALLEHLLDRRRPREFNWALIDLAATVCRPRGPLCSRCPLEDACMKGGVEECPDPEGSSRTARGSES
ncbi:MAG: DNA glycosylase [Armatimonadota bacterium]|nr:DNA glycosylase [Armatimonadota bacterium]